MLIYIASVVVLIIVLIIVWWFYSRETEEVIELEEEMPSSNQSSSTPSQPAQPSTPAQPSQPTPPVPSSLPDLPTISTSITDGIMWKDKPDAQGYYKYRCNGLYFRSDPVFGQSGWCIFVINNAGVKYGVLTNYGWNGDTTIDIHNNIGGTESSWTGYGIYCVPTCVPAYKPVRGTVNDVLYVIKKSSLKVCDNRTEYKVAEDSVLYSKLFTRQKNTIVAVANDSPLWKSKPEAEGTYTYTSDGLFYRSTPVKGVKGWCIYVAKVNDVKYGVITTYEWNTNGEMVVFDGLGGKDHGFSGYGMYCVDSSLPLYKPDKAAEITRKLPQSPRKCLPVS